MGGKQLLAAGAKGHNRIQEKPTFGWTISPKVLFALNTNDYNL
jgi:hypothetical protein